MIQTIEKPLLSKVFKDCRIIGLAGVKNSAKTNNLCFLLKDLLENKKIPVYAFGMPKITMDYLKSLGVVEISSLKHLLNKKDSMIVLDEYQLLKLGDRRYKDDLAQVVDFIYHNNNYLILSSPNIREFNTLIGGVIEKWLLKTVRVDQCINGSQLKKIVEGYKGRFKQLGSLIMPLDTVLVVNDECEETIHCDYVEKADDKKLLEKLF